MAFALSQLVYGPLSDRYGRRRLMLIGIALFSAGADAGHAGVVAVAGGLAVALLFGKAMVGPLFAQTAWTNVTFIGSEVREPGRNLSRALLYGCGIVVVLYVLANVAYIASLPLTEIQNAPQNRVAVAMMRAIFGTPGVLAIAAAIMIDVWLQ